MTSVQFGNTRQVYGFHKSELQTNQNRAYANKQTTSRFSYVPDEKVPVMSNYDYALMNHLETEFQTYIKAQGKLYSFPDFVRFIRQYPTITEAQKQKVIDGLKFGHQAFDYGAKYETNTRYEAPPAGHLNMLASVAASARPLPGGPVEPLFGQAPASILKRTRKHRKHRKSRKNRNATRRSH